MLSLKNVTEVAKAEKVVEVITSQVEAVFKVTDLKLSQWTDIHVYYEAKTVGGKDVVIEIAINTLDA
jgi:hypothetical protein